MSSCLLGSQSRTLCCSMVSVGCMFIYLCVGWDVSVLGICVNSFLLTWENCNCEYVYFPLTNLLKMVLARSSQFLLGASL